MKRLNIIFISLLAMVCTVLSCSDDSVEDKDIQKIDPAISFCVCMIRIC